MNKYKTNYVRTTKYTLLNFLPKSLLSQFLRLANIYFLGTAILQSVSVISPLNPITAILPLVFVLIVSMVREGIEDYRRYLEDKQANSQPVRVLSSRAEGSVELELKKQNTKLAYPDFNIDFPNCYDIVESKNVKVGQIILMYEDETFPSDLILLGTSNADGKAYIETAMLDGEKNLKKRLTDQRVNVMATKDRFIFHARVVCERPHHALDHFGGSILARNYKFPISEKVLLMKGAKLKNTKWVTGAVAFTGMETKLMLNTNRGRTKQSRVEHVMNKLIVIILITQTILSLMLGLAKGIWQAKKMDNHFYIDDDYKAGTSFVINFFSYFLLLSTMIPISLIVTLEIVKFAQLFLIQWDIFMYRNHKFAKVSTCTINEELGQVRYIFSDKTGTLTCNKMELKGLRIFDRCYGESMASQIIITPKIKRTMSIKVAADLEYNFHDPELNRILRDASPLPSINPCQMITKKGKVYDLPTDKDRAFEFLKLLACCHEVTGIKTKDCEYFLYAGQSPDEVCLVDAAQRIGVTFVDNRNNILTLSLGTEEEEKRNIKIELLALFPFNSNRARMSVIIRDEDGLVKLYTKGSDERLVTLLRKSKEEQNEDRTLFETESYLLTASLKGLRTLYMAMKVIDKDEFADWKARMDEVNIFVPGNEAEAIDKKKKYDSLVNEIERDLEYLGCTVVEDKLQDNVENTIHNLGKAGVQVWMITGDKMGTAKSIGYSCKIFIKRKMDIVQIDEDYYIPGSREIDVNKMLSKIKNSYPTDEKMTGLLITGMLVEKSLSNTEVKEEFIKFAKRCNAVVCCRTTANQKAAIVKAMKEACPEEITLSIGDGGNDVPMINQADVGVGIYGKEGMQAVQSADYAIGEFQCLWNLLMVHGRICYLRISELILYFFYKNFVFTLPQMLFAFWCGFSGQTFYDGWYISCYNLIFTSLPLLIKALFEHDVHHIKDRKLPLNRIYPYLYYCGQGNEIFNFPVIITWLFYGLLHACIVFFIPILVFNKAILTSDGMNEHFWLVSISSFTSVIFIVNLKLYTFHRFFTWINIFGFLVLSIGFYIIVKLISNYLELFLTVDSITQLYRMPAYYFTVLACVLLAYVIDHFIQVWAFHVNKTPSNLVRLWASRFDPMDNEENARRFRELQTLDMDLRQKNKFN